MNHLLKKIVLGVSRALLIKATSW